jgi:integrase
MTLPVLFRLMYSSGLRPNEARMLKRECVNLDDGVINVLYSKGRDQHYVVLHDSMLSIMRKYDASIQTLYPNRTFFFPAENDGFHTAQWMSDNLRKLWLKRNKSYIVPYDFRHNYAVENINSWTSDGFGFNDKLVSLSKSMGHSSLESSKYYYSLVPALADILEAQTGEEGVIPEVAYEIY